MTNKELNYIKRMQEAKAKEAWSELQQVLLDAQADELLTGREYSELAIQYSRIRFS